MQIAFPNRIAQLHKVPPFFLIVPVLEFCDEQQFLQFVIKFAGILQIHKFFR